MESTENQEVVNYKSQLVDRMKSKYPDRNFESIDGQESPNSLEQAIMEAFAESDGQIGQLTTERDEMNAKQEALSKLFYNSPRAAVFLNTLAETGDPSAAIYKAYGAEAKEALAAGDASEFITKIEAEDAQRRAEDEAFEEEKAANLRKSYEELDAWGNEKGLDEQGKVDVFMRFYNILADALVGKYSRDLFEMGYKADNYDADVENARREGEVSGRNAKIQEMARKRNEASATPPALSGQGVAASEPKPARKKENPWML